MRHMHVAFECGHDGCAMPVQHPLRDRLIAWGLVAIQFALVAAVVVIPRDPAWNDLVVVGAIAWAMIAVAVALGGWGMLSLGSGLTPLPLPNGQVELVTRGPYRWVRHPIYTAVVMGVAGIAILSRTPAALAIAVTLGLFLALKARWEEQHLSAAFPGYAEYAQRVGRLVPGVGRIG